MDTTGYMENQSLKDAFKESGRNLLLGIGVVYMALCYSEGKVLGLREFGQSVYNVVAERFSDNYAPPKGPLENLSERVGG